MNIQKKQREFIQEDIEKTLSSPSQLDALRNAHIFLPGGVGFLGSWILEFIAYLNSNSDFKTTVSIPYRNVEFFKQNRMHLFDNKAFSFFQCDVRNLGELPKDTTHIIHAAATSNRNDFASFPATAAENNINATSRIFRLSQGLSSLENILYLSSGLVYGRHLLNGPDLDENSFESSGTPFNSKNAYIESKRMSESFAAAFISESRLPIMVARPFAFVGPYQSLNLPWAITDFIRDCFQGGPVKIMGDGSHIRSIMYASDFANCVLNISANAKSRSVYNIGSDEAIDLVSLAKLISAQFKDAPQIITSVSNSFVKPDRLVPSLKKIQEDLGLHSSFNLKETISRAVNWYQLTHKE